MKFETQKRATLFQGYFRIDRLHVRHELFKGGWSETFTREVFDRGVVAAVLPYDPARDQVVMIEQFRAGPAAYGEPNPWMLEIVAGVVDTGESPEATARREAFEESGCSIGEVELIHEFYPSPGALTEKTFLFVGRTSTANLVSTYHGVPEEHEDIRTYILSRVEAIDWVNEGRIKNAISIIGLQWLALHHQQLRNYWLNGETGAATA